MNKQFGNEDAGLSAYVARTYVPEDAALEDVRRRADAAGLPDIQVAALDALHLEVLTRAAGARQVVEIGTLAGYSGLAILRGLAPGGHLHTIEAEPRHAAVARETFARAGVSDRVTIHVGLAMEILPRLDPQGPFDLVFVDADKEGYPAYLDWAARNLRTGGLLLADNAFAFGALGRPIDADAPPEARAMHDFHQRLSKSGEFRATVLPTGEGLTAAVRR